MRKKVVIALVGQKQSGKDTVARAIIQKDPSFVQYAFAEPVREAAKAFFGWDDSMFTGDKEAVDEFWGISPRQALQYIGTEVGRKGFASEFPLFRKTTGGSIWIKRFEKFANSRPETENIVISDMRFLNEMGSVLNLDKNVYFPIIIGIRREGSYGDGHDSEKEVLDCIQGADYVFDNNGSLSDIEDFADYILKKENII